jgi:TolA-binding protein
MLKTRQTVLLCLSLAAIAIGACSTTATPEAQDTPQASAPPSEIETLRREIASVRAELQSLSERQRTSEKNIESLQKGFRSGIFDAESTTAPSSTGQGIDLPQSQETPTPQIFVPSSKVIPASPESAAKKVFAEAELLISQKKHAEALASLGELEKQFPNVEDGGKSLLLMAECSIALSHSEEAITLMRKYYLKFPSSEEFLAAKILEARAHATLGARERALKVYKEVIALGPKTGYAQTARMAIQKLRDER